MTEYSRQELGWQPFFESQISFEESKNLIVAKVSSHQGSQIILLTEKGEISVASALVETNRDAGCSNIAIGDWLLLDTKDHRVLRQLDRKSELMRKAAGEKVKEQLIAANVDFVFIVSSCNQDFNLSRLERYLALCLESRVEPIVVLTKADLCDDPVELKNMAEALHPGLLVETIDARDRDQAAVLESWCRVGKTVSMLGSSGVGKSTLANALCGVDIKTQGIRGDDDKGRHTTTSRSMHRLFAGGWLIDNPGMRELQLPACEQGVADLFQDVLVLAEQCRFRNCKHQADAGCAIEAAVQQGTLDGRRLNNYLKLQSEQARNSSSLAERREQDRKTGKMYKSIIQSKKHRRHNN